MQISRHWRMNAQRYRLEGTRTLNGEVRFQPHLVADDDASDAAGTQRVEAGGASNERQPIVMSSTRSAAR